MLYNVTIFCEDKGYNGFLSYDGVMELILRILNLEGFISETYKKLFL